MIIKIRRRSDVPSSEITPETTYLRRREFIRAAGLGAVGLATGLDDVEAGGEKLTTVSRMVTTDDKQTPFNDVTTFNNFYEFGSDKGDPARQSGKFKATPWTVTVDGACGKPGMYTLEDILKPHPLQERVYRMRCVEAWSMVIPWVGFPLADLLKRFEPAGDAAFVEFTSISRPTEMPGQRVRFPKPLLPWPYREGLRMDEALHPLTIVAVGLYGETLLNQNGAPIRLVMPWKYGFKGIKSVAKISFVKKQPVTAWVEEERTYYGFYANVNPKVDHPLWSQARERRLGEFLQRPTLMFNGYADDVSSMYNGMDLKKNF